MLGNFVKKNTPGSHVNYKWWVLFAVSVGLFTSVFDHGSINVALPSIADQFNTDLPTTQWIVIGYGLTIAALLLPMGRLSDILGRKKIYLLGFMIFATGGFLAAISPNIELLIGTKILQGVGSAMTQGTSMAMVISSFGDKDRGRAPKGTYAGITTTSASSTINGQSIQFDYEENSNYLEIPPEVIGVTKLFRFDGSNTATNNMFSLKYQLFLNDIAFNWGTTELLSYAMTRTYLSDIDFLLNTEKQIRFNQRQDRLYIDIDWAETNVGDWFIIDCWRALNPSDYTRVWNDSFLKPYTVALMKRQWGQNLMKFQGVKLPGGVELNGRQMYDDAEKDLDRIRERMSSTYELPPLDMIG